MEKPEGEGTGNECTGALWVIINNKGRNVL